MRAFGGSVEGTNCGNCEYFKRRKQPQGIETNEQGGVAAPDKRHLKMAEEADLVTLPGDDEPGQFGMCGHPSVDQLVTDRMCCALWDNKGAKREWE